MKLHTMNLGGNVHEAARYLNKMGLARYVVSIDYTGGSMSVAVLRASINQVNKWREKERQINITEDDPPKPKKEKKSDVPKDGAEAFAQGYSVNPWNVNEYGLEHRRWEADWHQANFESYRSFLED